MLGVDKLDQMGSYYRPNVKYGLWTPRTALFIN